MRTAVLLPILLLVCACKPQSERNGTFIGNPSLSARYLDNAVQIGRGGFLRAPELGVIGCNDTPSHTLGPTSFTFDGSLSVNTEDLEPGHYCYLFVVVQELTITFDQPGVGEASVTGQDFDLVVPTDFRAEDGGDYIAQFGGPDWLATMGPLVQAGQNDLRDNPALRDAYYEGLNDGSEVGNVTQ